MCTVDCNATACGGSFRSIAGTTARAATRAAAAAAQAAPRVVPRLRQGPEPRYRGDAKFAVLAFATCYGYGYRLYLGRAALFGVVRSGLRMSTSASFRGSVGVVQERAEVRPADRSPAAVPIRSIIGLIV